MKDYMSIGQILDLKKYDDYNRLSDFKDKEFFILSVKSIKGNDKDGFEITIEDLSCNQFNIKTFSRTITREIKDLLLISINKDGVFEQPIKCKLSTILVKTKNGNYYERYKLI